MQLHLVGGFLGSGKTTAIIAAAQGLISEGLTVGIVTNDQGKYLVDTTFVRLSDLPAVEVTGGCFCCNYNDLNDRLVQFIGDIDPDVVFAESVGSCADIVATVVKPMLDRSDARIQPSSYSVFVDSRLFLRWLEGQALPFSEDVVYIFEKQIEEAGILIVNKADLLSSPDRQKLKEHVNERFSGLVFRFQNSLDSESVQGWVELIQSGTFPLPGGSLEIDYDRYGRGEMNMAWFDEILTLTIDEGNPRLVIIDFFTTLLEDLQRDRVGIGHMKFVLNSGDISTKISFTSIENDGWERNIPEPLTKEVRILVNVRAETSASRLYQYFKDALRHMQEKHSFSFVESDIDYFYPGKPKPTYRIP